MRTLCQTVGFCREPPRAHRLRTRQGRCDRRDRHHLDLYADDQQAEIERLLALGAFPVVDWVYESDADYVVLEDPDGNRFCVVQT
jgi:hypothetical protein